MILSGCSPALARGGLHTIPAHWVETIDAIEPQREFTFNALDFVSPDNGWIVGDRYLLHVDGDNLSVTFNQPWSTLYTVVMIGRDDVWMGGVTTYWSGTQVKAMGVLSHLIAGRWQPVDVAALASDEWAVQRLAFADATHGWALATVGAGTVGASRSQQTILLQFDGVEWKRASTLPVDHASPGAALLCVATDGTGWLIGSEGRRSGQRVGYAFTLQEGAWVSAAPPPVEAENVTFKTLECSPRGRAFTAGIRQNDGEPKKGFLVTYNDGAWRELKLPDANLGAVRISALSDSELWIAASYVEARPDWRPVFLHWQGERWTIVDPPALPYGRRDGYDFEGIDFTSPSRGWAIASSYIGGPLNQGVIFQYTDGTWTRRSWNWHFWNEPWFGLGRH
jgi:hypothetical protein